MKFLTFIIVLSCCSCASPELRKLRSKVADLRKITIRDDLYKALPPIVSPKPAPKVFELSGARGNETYLVDEKHRVEYEVLYYKSLNYKDQKDASSNIVDFIIANPDIGHKILPDSKDIISHIRIQNR